MLGLWVFLDVYSDPELTLLPGICVVNLPFQPCFLVFCLIVLVNAFVVESDYYFNFISFCSYASLLLSKFFF